MKNREIFDFVRDFHLFNGLEGFDFILLLNKNKRLFEIEIEDLQKTRENNPLYKKYVETVQALMKGLADKDKHGEPIIDRDPKSQNQGTYRVTENLKALEDAQADLIHKYKVTIEKQNKLNSDFEAKLEKDILCTPYLIKEEMLPRNIKSEQMTLVFPLIKFKPEKKKAVAAAEDAPKKTTRGKRK